MTAFNSEQKNTTNWSSPGKGEVSITVGLWLSTVLPWQLSLPWQYSGETGSVIWTSPVEN